MHTDDLQQALRTLGLDNVVDPEVLKHSLYRILLENPTDPRTDQRSSSERMARYELALEVKEVLFPDKKRPSRELVLRNRVITLVRQAVAEEERKEERRTREQERVINNHHTLTKRRYATPRVTSAILAAVFGALLALSKTWEDNPIFTPFRKALATQEYKQKAAELANRALPVAIRADSVFAMAATFVQQDSLVLSPQKFTQSFNLNLDSSPNQAFTQLRAQIEEAQQDFRHAVVYGDSTRKVDAETARRLDAMLGERSGLLTDSARYVRVIAIRDSMPLKRADAERVRDSLLAVAEPLFASSEDSAAVVARDSALVARRFSFRRDSLEAYANAEAAWPQIRDQDEHPLDWSFDALIDSLIVRRGENNELFYQAARERPQLRFGLTVIDSLWALRNRWVADSSRIELFFQSTLSNSSREDVPRRTRRQQELAHVEAVLDRLRENERIISAEIARLENDARAGAESKAAAYRSEYASERSRAKIVKAVTDGLARSAFQVRTLQEDLAIAQKASDNRADEIITLTLVASLIVTGLGYLLFWLRERSDERWGDLLATETATELVVDRIFRRARWTDEGELVFSITMFSEAVATKDVQRPLRWVLGTRLDEGRAAPLVAMLLKRLLDRQAIVRKSSSSVLDWYAIDPRVLAEYGIERPPARPPTRV